MHIPIEDQVKEVARELRQRDHVYPRMIEANRLKQATADHHVAHLQAALATLEFIAAHAAGLRALVHFLRSMGAETDPSRVMTATPAEVAALKAHPAVAAVLKAFPDAAISVAPVKPPQAEMFQPEEETA